MSNTLPKFNFCYLCGSPTETITTHDGTHWRCTGCGQTFYHNPSPAAEAVLFDEQGRVAVATRGREPHKGKLDLPGGFIDAGETLEQGMARELTEELGLNPADYSALVYLTSAANDYPWIHEVKPVTVAAFTARLNSTAKLNAQDDVAKIEFMQVEELNPEDFSWPSQYPLILLAAKYWQNH